MMQIRVTSLSVKYCNKDEWNIDAVPLHNISYSFTKYIFIHTKKHIRWNNVMFDKILLIFNFFISWKNSLDYLVNKLF